VPYESVLELSPTVDPPLGEVLKPGSRRVGKVQRDALDDYQVVAPYAVVAARRQSSSQMLGLVSPLYFATVVEARYRAGGVAARTFAPKAHEPRGSGVGLWLWCSLLS
jgi:hypothetical protein